MIADLVVFLCCSSFVIVYKGKLHADIIIYLAHILNKLERV